MSASVFYKEPHAAIRWLCEAFGFEVQLKVEGKAGEIVHSELKLAEGLVMVSGEGTSDNEKPWQALSRSPLSLDGSMTQALAFYIDAIDEHHARAVAKGARIIRALETNDYGEDYWSDRSYGALDPEGHLWWFMQRMRG